MKTDYGYEFIGMDTNGNLVFKMDKELYFSYHPDCLTQGALLRLASLDWWVGEYGFCSVHNNKSTQSMDHTKKDMVFATPDIFHIFAIDLLYGSISCDEGLETNFDIENTTGEIKTFNPVYVSVKDICNHQAIG